jgi:FixJ family two-component response regulator
MEYLESSFIGETRCLISDVAMPGMSGPELRRELVRPGYAMPIILITAHRNVEFRPEVLDGAIACLIKPFEEAILFSELKKALHLVKTD